MADCLAADIGLGDLVHGDGGLHADLNAALLEAVCNGKGVDAGRKHAHVVGSGALHTVAAVFHAAPEVAAADDDADLHAGFDTLFDHVAHAANHVKVQPAVRVARQCLAADFQQHPMIFWFAHAIPLLICSFVYSIISSGN